MKKLIAITTLACAVVPAAASPRQQTAPISDPAKLNEIIERALQTAESPDDGSAVEAPVSGRITSGVGLRADPFDGGIRMHYGIDVAVPEGTPVNPVASGTVAYSGRQPGYGNMVIVRHPDGMHTVYAHHRKNLVSAGQKVEPETVLALAGSTGRSTGPHLHFEAWSGGKNITRSFLSLFSGRNVTTGSDASLEKTNLRRVVLSDGTVMFVEKKQPVRGGGG